MSLYERDLWLRRLPVGAGVCQRRMMLRRRDLLSYLAIGSTAALIGCQRLRHPSDSSLIARFKATEGAFAQLVAMARSEPHARRIAPGFVRLETGGALSYPDAPDVFPISRWRAYRTIFEELGLEQGIAFWQPDQVIMIARTLSRSGKGYIWSSQPMTPSVERLDGVILSVESEINSDVRAYRPLKPEWALFYEEYGR